MTIILRLQGLDAKAGTEDIRTFFEGLHIPDGGVCIVGGSLREAFIAFNTERAAQLAMRFTGNFLKGSKVTLHLSNMAELECQLKSVLKKRKSSKLTVKRPLPHPSANRTSVNAQPHVDNTSNLSPSTACTLDPDTASLPPLNAQHDYPTTANVQTSDAPPLDSATAFILGICTVLQGLPSYQRETDNTLPTVDIPEAVSTAVVSDEVRTPGQIHNSRPGYIRVFGLPSSVTKEDICFIFKGLAVQETIVNVKLGVTPACLVKFANTQDAHDALKYNQKSMGSFSVDVRNATEKMWYSALQECEKALDVGETQKPQRNSLESLSHKNKSPALSKRQSESQLPSKPPKESKLDTDSTTHLSPTVERIVMVSNLPKEMTKTEIKELFGCPNIPHKNVLHLLDKEGKRTDTAFLIFNHTEDYDYAMNLTGCHVGSDTIKVSSITREVMREKLAKSHPRSFKHCLRTDPRKKTNQMKKTGPPGMLLPSMNPEVQTCLFVRNMPADVQKNQIKNLFGKYKMREDDITLLHASDGSGTGEAVVQFKSEKLAELAQRIHGNNFQGEKLLLTRINAKQREDILAKNMYRT